MRDRDYCYPPDFTVLKNRLNLTNARDLEYFETEFVMQRVAEGVPSGDFDLDHLKVVHRHLFQDIYEWAGQLRTVEISKNGHQFQFRRFIETGMADVHRRLVDHNFLKGLSAADFAYAAGQIIGDVNYVHPFREGNGRVQLLYLEQLARHAGHPIDLGKLIGPRWIAASRQAHVGNYAPMGHCIAVAIGIERRSDRDDHQR